ncbi:MAG: C40 family peptidase [Clostridiales bacterium]|nr:C40 family peptidase [Clostridiales bacterium]
MKPLMYMAAVLAATGSMMWAAPGAALAEEINPAILISEPLELESVEEESCSQVLQVGAESEETQEEADPETTQEETEETAAEQKAFSARQQVVSYALQFLGGRYCDGGNDPHTGVDCSGFVRYVMQNGAGISMNRSSVSQATQGRQISSGEMQPGDLIFYGNGARINHVAMYIGDGQVVHASTYKTGIKISRWNYRDPIKIISMFG